MNKDSFGQDFNPDKQKFRVDGIYCRLIRSDFWKTSINKHGVGVWRMYQQSSQTLPVRKEINELVELYFDLGFCNNMTLDYYIAGVKDKQ